MLDAYKRYLKAHGYVGGNAITNHSVKAMDATFKRDPAYRIAKIDGEDIEIKFLIHNLYSIASDSIDYHVQFRPGVHYPLGTYIDIPDDTGTYKRWLIVGRNDNPTFVRYNVLKCNWTFKWIYEGKIHSVLGCIRSRNSYNSGVWTDYYITSVENQISFWIPTDDNTNTIDYDQRFLITQNKLHPVAWSVSKREDVIPIGITKITCKQDKYNPMEDNPDLLIANYYSNVIAPEEIEDDSETIVENVSITYKGSTPNIKCGGSKKTFTAFKQDEEIAYPVSWNVDINPEYEDYITYTVSEDSTQLQLQCSNYYDAIGQIITVSIMADGNDLDSLELEVISL